MTRFSQLFSVIGLCDSHLKTCWNIFISIGMNISENKVTNDYWLIDLLQDRSLIKFHHSVTCNNAKMSCDYFIPSYITLLAPRQISLFVKFLNNTFFWWPDMTLKTILRTPTYSFFSSGMFSVLQERLKERILNCDTCDNAPVLSCHVTYTTFLSALIRNANFQLWCLSTVLSKRMTATKKI